MDARKISIILIMALVGYGCAGLNLMKLDKRALLEKRVNQYVSFKKVEAFDKEYEFLSPNYRKKITLVKFIRAQKNKLDNISVKSIEYTSGEDIAKVKLEVDMMAMGFNLKGMIFTQQWVFVDKQWYYDAQPLGFKQLFMPKKTTEKKTGK